MKRMYGNHKKLKKVVFAALFRLFFCMKMLVCAFGVTVLMIFTLAEWVVLRHACARSGSSVFVRVWLEWFEGWWHRLAVGIESLINVEVGTREIEYEIWLLTFAHWK
jgi:hypothetical protein